MKFEPGVSLLSLSYLTVPSLQLLANDTTFPHVALTPTQLSPTGLPPSSLALASRCREIALSGKKVSSIQGILYGLKSENHREIKDRVQWLSSALDYLDCDTLVLGAASARAPNNEWENCVNTISSTLPQRHKLVIENICIGSCSHSVSHPWLLGENPDLLLAYDFSNATECAIFSPTELATKARFELAHVSGLNHCETLEKSRHAEFVAVLNTLQSHGLKSITIEIQEREIEALLKKARRFHASFFGPEKG